MLLSAIYGIVKDANVFRSKNRCVFLLGDESIGRQMGMHESTVSRKMDKLTGTIRKRIRSRLRAGGMHQRRCSEVMEELDVQIECRCRGQSSARNEDWIVPAMRQDFD